MKNQTTILRKKIDFLIQCALVIKNSAETTLAWRSLQMAKAWLGKALAAMGEPSPYHVVDDVSKIPPTSDIAEYVPPFWEDELAAINDMRQKISEIVPILPQEENQRRCYQKAIDHLEEARMWYGFQLQTMRPSNATEVVGGELDELVQGMNNGLSLEYFKPEHLNQQIDWSEPLDPPTTVEDFQEPFTEPRDAPTTEEILEASETLGEDEVAGGQGDTWEPEFTDKELEAIVPINSTPKKKKK